MCGCVVTAYVFCDHDVFGLQIPVDNEVAVQILQDQYELSYIELRFFVGEEADFSDGIEQLHSLDVLCQEVNVVFVLERADELHDKGRVEQLHHLFFLLSPQAIRS